MSRFRHVMHISARGQGPHHCLSRGTEQAVVLRRHHGPGRCDLFTAFLAGQSEVRLHSTYKIGYEYFLMFCLPRDSVKYTSITIVLFSFSAVSRRLHARNLILGIPTHIMVGNRLLRVGVVMLRRERYKMLNSSQPGTRSEGHRLSATCVAVIYPYVVLDIGKD